MVEYRVRLVVYDVLDVQVEIPSGAAQAEIMEAALAEATRDHPLVSWLVDKEASSVTLEE